MNYLIEGGNLRKIPIIELGTENFDKENTIILSTVIGGKDEVLAQLKHIGYKKVYDIQNISPYEDEFFSFYFNNKGYKYE